METHMALTIRTPLEQARPGSVLAEPAFHPLTMQLLLPAGSPLTPQAISMLVRSGVRQVALMDLEGVQDAPSAANPFAARISDLPPAAPTLSAAPEIRDAAPPAVEPQAVAVRPPSSAPVFPEERLEVVAREVVTRNFAAIREIERQFHQSSSVDFQKVDGCVQTTLREIVLNREILESLVDLRVYDEYTYAHSANVMSLALLMGVTLGFNYEKLRTLGVGAMLHDIGKTMIPDFILNKPGRLTPAEFDVIKTHPERGLKMIAHHRWATADIQAVILHHHERWDGRGYPHGLKGKDIPEMARIVSVVDVYDALVSRRVYKEPMPPDQAYQLILSGMNTQFEARMVWAFQNLIVPYPCNAVVVLSNGDVAKVRRVNKNDPLRPVVEMQDGTQVDLASQQGLVVKDLHRPPLGAPAFGDSGTVAS